MCISIFLLLFYFFSLKSLTNLCIYYYYKFEITNNISQRGPIGDLASALANASPKQQRTMLRGNLYPHVGKLEPDAAAKVTEILLEMDQTEILHLLESPEESGR